MIKSLVLVLTIMDNAVRKTNMENMMKASRPMLLGMKLHTTTGDSSKTSTSTASTIRESLLMGEPWSMKSSGSSEMLEL